MSTITPTVDQRRFLSVSDAASYTGTSVSTIRRRIADGSLTAHRFGPRTVRIDRAQLHALSLRHRRRCSATTILDRPVVDDLYEYARQVVADWPPLTNEQSERIWQLFRGGAE